MQTGLFRFLLLGILLWGSIVLAHAQERVAPELRAAAGKVDITPNGPAYLAGYEQNRKSVDAHDRLMARCLALQYGELKMAIVSCDLIGVPRFETLQIRGMIHSVPSEHVIIAATHTHSGPDTLGMWGPALTASGVDQNWLAELESKIAKLVDETSARMEPVAVRFASTTAVPRISKNIRIPQVLDTELGVMQVLPAGGGKPIATFVNYACHPEILDTRHITADFPHWLYTTVEGDGGGVCLYLNGAQGGMITADYDETTAPKGQNWKAAEEIGTNLGKCALNLISNATIEKSAPITFDRRVYSVPLENDRYKALIALKVFPNEPLKDGMLETEVCRFTIGPAEFLTLPGEVLPNIGLYLKSLMHGKPRFLLGLTGDFLGYILTPEDFGLKLYTYESHQSVGPQMEPLMVRNLRSMIDAASHP